MHPHTYLDSVIAGLEGIAPGGRNAALNHAAWTLGRWHRANVSLAAARPPEFYRRLERVLARLPLIRRHGQTPQELAAAAQGRLDTVPTAALAASVPADVVASYYRVRFGGCHLDMSEMEAIEQALAELDHAVRHRSK